MDRKKNPADIETNVLTRSARRCALCYSLDGDLREKKGQIAHLDKDPSNCAEDNLAYLCLEHHSQYDSRTSQNKNYTMQEVKGARTKLYEAIAQRKHHSTSEERADQQDTALDPVEYWNQRKRLPISDILRKIWSMPRWCIWIRPTEFRKARFRSLEECHKFIRLSYVEHLGPVTYPYYPHGAIATCHKSITSEVDASEEGVVHRECWVLFQSGHFVYNRAFDENSHLAADCSHVLEILETTTGALEFAARMARRGLLVPKAAVTFELQGVDSRRLTWPQDALGDANLVD